MHEPPADKEERLLSGEEMGALPTADAQRDILGIIPLEEALADMKAALSEVYGLSDPYNLEVNLSTIATVQMPGDPLWFFQVGPPSGMKTEMLRWFGDEDRVYTLSSLTSHSLITGLEKGRDLLPELDGRVLIIKDFSTILEMRRESREEIFAQLRDSFDGYAENFYGTVGRKSFHSHFHLVAAVTGAIERYYSAQSWLGQRFLMARVPEVDGFERALETSGGEESIRDRFRDLVRRFMNSIDLDGWRKVDASRVKELRPAIELVAKARTHVPRDSSSTIRGYPEPEMTPRLAKQLRKLCIGRAMIHGRKEVTDEDLAFARRVVLDTIPSQRRRAMMTLLDGPLSLDDLTQAIRLPRSTTHRLKEDLEMLGLVRRHSPDGQIILYELEDRVAKVLAQETGSTTADTRFEETTSPPADRPIAKDERVLAQVIQNQGFGVCDVCHQTAHDLLIVRPRGSRTKTNVCGRCGEARFDFDAPPRKGDPAYA